VVDKAALTDGSAGMYLNAGREPRELRNYASDKLQMMAMQKIRKPMEHLRPHARIANQHLETISRRWVAALRRPYIFRCILKKTHASLAKFNQQNHIII
jgi:hypothetical protein